MEIKQRLSTENDRAKHSFAQPKLTSKRVLKGISEESIGMTGYNLIHNLIMGTINHLRQDFSQLKTVGGAYTFESWPTEKVVN